ncbi:MAG: PAS domain S-box protein [Burkholderiales bacterium]|nr:PAS domain S-box protein [Burkholderiales bacterium]
MRLLPKIVLVVLAPILVGMVGAALMLNLRLQIERDAAVARTERALADRAAGLAAQLQLRRNMLRLLAATPALRMGGAPEAATLRAWSGVAGLFDHIEWQAPGAADAPPDDTAPHWLPGPAAIEWRQRVVSQGGGLAGWLVARTALPPLLTQGEAAEAARGVQWTLADAQGRPIAGPALGPASGLEQRRHPVAGTGWHWVHTRPAPSVRDLVGASVLRVVWLLGLVIVVALLGAWWVHRMITQPLTRLREAHADVQAGNLDVRAQESGQFEVAELARSFNRMAASLATADRKFRLVFEAFPHPVMLSRYSDGRYLDANPAFTALTGHSRAELLGHTVEELGLVEDAEALRKQMLRLREEGHVDGEAVHFTDATGQQRWLLYAARLLQIGDERVVLTVGTDITALKDTEERLRRSEQSFFALFDSAPLPLSYSRRHDGQRYSIWNQAWYRATGYSREQAERRRGLDFGFWVDASERARYSALARHEGLAQGFVAQMRHQDGSLHWYELSGQLITTSEGVKLMTAYVDITQQRLAQAASEAAQARLQAVFDASPVAMLVADIDQGWQAVAANSVWFRQFGREPAQVLGHDGVALRLWVDAVHREQLLGQLQHDGDMVQGFDTEMQRGDGSHLLVRIAARRFRAGERNLLVMVYEDITERTRAEQALKESRALMAHTFDLTPEPMTIIGEDGRFLDVNRMWVQISGIPRQQAVGRTAMEVGLHTDLADWRALREQFARDGKVTGQLVTYHLPDGRSIRCEVSANRLVAQGRPISIWITRDITERERARAALQELNETLEHRVAERTAELSNALEGLRRAQAELVQAEKLASLGALVAGVAHELNTPIGNAVMVASTLADHRREFEAAIAGGLRRTALETYLASAREASQVLERNLQRAAELVGSFKQLAVDQSSVQRRSFELAEVLQEVLLALSPTLRRSGVTLVDEVPAGLLLDSYPGPLGQVLVNLISNALVHAFEPGSAGTITVAAGRLDERRLWLRLRDDGRGIPPEALGRIFDPFFTTRLGQGGSGLGLHIVYNLVTGLLGGRIEVRSEPGAGAEFVIELPVQAPAA